MEGIRKTQSPQERLIYSSNQELQPLCVGLCRPYYRTGTRDQRRYSRTVPVAGERMQPVWAKFHGIYLFIDRANYFPYKNRLLEKEEENKWKKYNICYTVAKSQHRHESG